MAKSKKKVEKPEAKAPEKPIENQESVKDWTPPPRDPKYRVAKGKSVACKKGIVVEGQPIVAISVGGEEHLLALVERGVVEVY